MRTGGNDEKRRDDEAAIVALAYRLFQLNPARLADELKKLRAKLRETSAGSKML